MRWLVGFFFALASFSASAQEAVDYGERALSPYIRDQPSFEPLGNQVSGETINETTGAIRFSQVDLDIPGNDALTVAVNRRLVLDGNKSPSRSSDAPLWSGYSFGEWEFDVPYVSGIYSAQGGWTVDTGSPQARCLSPTTIMQFEPKLEMVGEVTFMGFGIWNGLTLNVPGSGEESLQFNANPGTLAPAGAPPRGSRLVSQSNWRFDCLASLKSGQPGEGFLGRAPDGTQYHFDHMVAYADRPIKGSTQIVLRTGPRTNVNAQLPRNQYRLYASKVVDRFGNSVEYQWSGNRLNAIVASDGRRIDFTHNANGTVATATSGNRTVNYAYSGGFLTGVTLPDGSAWGFNTVAIRSIPRFVAATDPNPREQPYDCQSVRRLSGQTGNISITHPSGATASYTLGFRRALRTNLRGAGDCQATTGDTTTGGALAHRPWFPIYNDVLSVQQKTLSGPALTNATWQYAYVENFSIAGSGSMASYPVNGTRVLTVTDPMGNLAITTFGTDTQLNEGQVLSTVSQSGANILSRTDMSYIQTSEIASLPFPDRMGELFVRDDASTTAGPAGRSITGANRPLKTRVITQQGATFTRAITAFDALVRPITVVRSSAGTGNDRSRTDTTEYHDNAALWVLGQTQKVVNTNTGVELQKTEFDANAMPWKLHENGQLKSILLYDTASSVSSGQRGTLTSLTDGNGNVTALSNWKRGTPQQIHYPPTAESPTGAIETSVVNDHGWITQKTDENGFSENYQHDAMGRTSRVDYPSSDLTAWAPTLIDFQQINTTEYGIAAGHWKRTRTTGNRTDITYYDGLWRPLVSETFDASNPAATKSITVKRYDQQGRTSFESRPVASISAYTDSLGGTTSQHDAIDRLTQSVETSELGNLTTTVEYLTGLQTKITNPRNAITQTAFTAWDEPTDSMPVSIQLPEGRVTDLSRDALGDVTVIKRRNTANTQSLERKFVRDAHRRICKQIDPESGSTVRDFDNANNVIWQASGLNLPSTTSCDTASAYSSGRRIDVTWDARNRETQRNFPDGRGNTATTYYPDNLVHSKTTYNDPSSGAPVVSTQTYDKRRFLRSDESTQPGWYAWGSNLGYDAIGNVSSRSYPNALVVNFHPNALGHPTLVQGSDGQTLANNISMYPNGALQSFTYGNGIVHTMLQNARQLPSRSTDVGVLDFTFGYDATRNPTEILDQLRGAHYNRWMQYDLAERLTDAGSCSFGGDCWHRNTYDVFDNIKSWKLPGVRDYANYQYSARNLPEQIKDSASTTVVNQSFDLQGNLSNKNGQAYSFDFGNRLREVVGKQWSRYDGYGHRVLRWEASEPGILSLYSIDNQLLYDDNNRASSRTSHLFVYLQGSLLATKERNLDTNNERWTYQHTDALGSPVAITDTSGTVIERTDWEPWGNAIGKPNMDTVGFTGHQMDGSTQLIHMQQRYYDPNTAQFLSSDPVNVDINTGVNFNRRLYAANNPYSFKDPDGRQECRSCELVYGASASTQLTSSQRRIWQRGERAAGTAGGGAEEGAAIMDSVVALVSSPSIDNDDIARFAVAMLAAKITHGRGGKQFRGPDPEAKGAHTRFRTDQNGKVTHYETYEFPNSGIGKRVDVVGPAHGGVPTPHVVDTTKHTNPKNPNLSGYKESKPRRARPDEIPRR